MEKYNNYEFLDMNITLMKKGYDMEDINNLFNDPFDTLYHTRIGFEWRPSVVGHEAMTIELIFKFVLTGASTVLVSKLTSDIYDWTKKSLVKVLGKKSDVQNSSIQLKFDDVMITIYIGNKSDLIEVMNNIHIVIDYVKEKEILDKSYSIDPDELMVVKGKFNN